MYRPSLALIHHLGFSEFARSASQGIIAILRKQGIEDGLLVDAGCGSGVLARELLDAGYRVHGFDASPAMIALARETAPEATLEVASLSSAVLPRCRAVVATGEVLNHGTLDEVRSFFRRAADALEPGGMLLFDIAERDSHPRYDEVRTGGDDWSVIAVKESDGDRVVRRVFTFRLAGGKVERDEETHHLQLFDRRLVIEALHASGFSVRVRRSYGKRRLPKGYALYVATVGSDPTWGQTPSTRCGFTAP